MEKTLLQIQDEKLNLTELRTKYPEIQAVSKVKFIEKLYPKEETTSEPDEETLIPLVIKKKKPEVVSEVDKAADEVIAAQDKAAKKFAARIKRAQHASRPDYLPKITERHVYHVELDHMKFDQNTGEKISIDQIQTFTKKEWTMFLKFGKKTTGYKTKILWDPTKY